MKTQGRAFVAIIASLTLAATTASAQETPTWYRACYVPQVGAMYLLDLPGLPTACLSTDHQEITWTDGGTPVADGSITAEKLAVGAVTGAKLAQSAVGSQALAPEAVTGEKIAEGAISRSHVQNGIIGSLQLANRAVIRRTLDVGSVDSPVVANNSLTADDLAPGAVTLERTVVEGETMNTLPTQSADQRLSCPQGSTATAFAWGLHAPEPGARFVIQANYPVGENEWYVRFVNTGETYVGMRPQVVCLRAVT